MNTDSTDYVSILVPQRHLTRIYGFIASLDAEQGIPETAVTVETTKEDEWPPELIEKQYRESPDSMKQFQQYLAAHPGQEFSTPELAEALGAKYGWNTIAGALGAYGRRVKNRYKRSSFPFQTRWDYNDGNARHSMTQDVADIIKSLD